MCARARACVCCNGYLVSPLGGRVVREEGSQIDRESRSERLSVVVVGGG